MASGPAWSGVPGPDPYEALGISRHALQEEVRQAYRRLALLHHPDRGGDPRHFRTVAEAYEVLGDAERRRRYDLFGELGSGPPAPSAAHARAQHVFETAFARASAAPADASGAHFGRPFAESPRAARRRTEDTVRELAVTLEELYTGATQHVDVQREVPDVAGGVQECPGCHGRGLLPGGGPAGALALCGRCGGRGFGARMRLEQHRLPVVIERGAADGHRIVLPGGGHQSAGSDAGDLVFVLRQAPHPSFRRSGADLFLERAVPLFALLTGAGLDVRHLDGRWLHIRPQAGGLSSFGGFPGLPSDGWEHFEDTDVFGLAAVAAEVHHADVEACRRICRLRGFSGFVVRRGASTLFRAEPRKQLLEGRFASTGATLQIVPDPEKAAQRRLLKAVRGEGMPVHGQPLLRGNLFLSLSVDLPRTLDAPAAALLQQALPQELARAAESAAAEAASGNALEEHCLQAPSAQDIDRVTAGAAAGSANGLGSDEVPAGSRSSMHCHQQ